MPVFWAMDYFWESFLDALTKLRKGTVNFVMYVLLSEWNNSAPTGRIFMKFDIVFSETPSRKFNFHQNRTRITRTLHEYHFTFLIISSSVLLRMKNVSDKSCREFKNTYFMFSNFFFRKTCGLWDNVKNIVEPGMPQYGACALHAGYLRLQTHTQNM